MQTQSRRLAAPLIRALLLALAAAALAWTAALPTAADEAASPQVSFHNDIRPILTAHCAGCHQPAKAGGSLQLTSHAGLLAEGDSGQPAIVPGDPEASYLVELITPDEDGVALMPQEGEPLAADQISLIRQWIVAGAHDDSPDGAPQYSADQPPIYQQPATITALDVSPDGQWLAVSGYHEVLLHRLAPSVDSAAASQIASASAPQREPVARLVGLSERIDSIRFSPDGTRLAVTGGSPARFGELQVWDVAERELILSHQVTNDTIYGAGWSPDGKLVSFGGGDATVRAVDAATGEQVLYQSAHDDWSLDTLFSLDGGHLVSAGRDGALKLIEVATQRFVDNITSITPGALKGGIHTIDRHPLRDEVLYGGADGVPRIYQMFRNTKREIGDDANLLWELPALPGRIYGVRFSRDARRIVAGSSLDGIGTVHVYAMEPAPEIPDTIREILHKPTHQRSSEQIEQLEAHFAAGVETLGQMSIPSGGVFAVSFTPDGERIVVGGEDGKVRILAAQGAAVLEEFIPVPIEAHEDSSSGEAQHADDPSPVNFRTDVMPLLAKLGCNAGTCHGSKDGKNGFKLSLRGYDPLGDHRALTDDLKGRRTNRAAPDQSLMLLKAVAAVPHVGGERTTVDSKYFDVIRDWIAQGMPDDPQAPRVSHIELTPDKPVLQQTDGELQVGVVATYSDGQSREVTDLAFFESSNIDVAQVDESGKVQALRRGEAALMARYEGAYAATPLTIMGDRDGFVWPDPPAHNYIDELVYAKQQRVKSAPSGLSDDEQFLRRVYLDLTGLLPEADAVREFLDDQRPTRIKREELIDRLVGSPEYIDHFTNKWCDLLQVNGKYLGREGATAFRQWIREAVAANMPYNEFAHSIIVASGSNRENPPASYYKVLRTPDALMENTTHLFLAVRFNCNKCHDHPFERWTQDQYYGMAAFFGRVGLEKDPESGDRNIGGTAVEGAKPLYEIVVDRPEGEVTHERTGEVAPPAFPYEHAFDAPPEATRRERLAAWITAADNRYFAMSYVNRLWGYLLGVGIIEPIDDIRAGNPPSNPELLETLTRDFVDSGFDVQHLVRTICKSRTYQLSSETNRWNEDDHINFTHAQPRRLPAEVLYDAVHQAVGAAWQLPGVPPGTRAAQLPDVAIKLPDGFLDQLGRPARESACECERTDDLMLGPVMALVNGPAVSEAIVDPQNELAQLEAEIDDDRLLVEELFLRVLGRMPTADEISAALTTLQSPGGELAVVSEQFRQRAAEVDAALPTWIESHRVVDWTTASPEQLTSNNGAELIAQDDQSVLATGPNGKGKYVVVLQTRLPRITGLRLEVLTDERLPAGGPGRSGGGNFVLSELRVSAAPLDDPAAIEKVGLRNAAATFSQDGFNVTAAIDENPGTGWAVSPQVGKPQTATFELRGKVGFEHGTRFYVELDQQHDDEHQLGRFRLSLSGNDPPITPHALDLPVDIVAILRLDENQRTDRQRSVLRDYHRSLDADYESLERAVDLVANPRLVGLQDLAWALINTPAFLFNH